jgi:hypothetical protein
MARDCDCALACRKSSSAGREEGSLGVRYRAIWSELRNATTKGVVTGNFKVDPERFLLTLEGSAAPRFASVSPAFTSAFQEEVMGTTFVYSTFKQKSGLGWLIFRNKEGLAEKYAGETDRIFRLGYVYSGSQFIMRGRCVPF